MLLEEQLESLIRQYGMSKLLQTLSTVCEKKKERMILEAYSPSGSIWAYNHEKMALRWGKVADRLNRLNSEDL